MEWLFVRRGIQGDVYHDGLGTYALFPTKVWPHEQEPIAKTRDDKVVEDWIYAFRK